MGIMGTTRTVVIAIVLLIATSAAHAQSGPETPAQQPPPRPTAPPPVPEPGWLGDTLPPLWNRLYVNINAARQLQTGSFNTLSTFASYGETGSFETIQNVGTALLLDGSAGYHLAKHFAVGAGLWTAMSKSAVAGTSALPDPTFYGQYAIKTLSQQGLRQKTIGLNLQVLFAASLKDRLHVALFAGPTIARVKLDVGSLTLPSPTPTTTSRPTSPSQTSAPVLPNAADIVQDPAIVVASQTATTAKAATAGFDVSFMFTERYGVGVLARYVRGKVNLPIAPDMDVAGTQIGAGLRYRF